MSGEAKSPESYTEKEKWAMLHGSQKIRYIWDYYKLPILIVCIVLYVIGYSFYRSATKKDVLLYAALVNVSAGDSFKEQIRDDFLSELQGDPKKEKIQLYDNWYLTDDPASEYHQYTYATRMKVLASIDSQELDVVLMNREAFDAFAQNGYLCDLDELLGEKDPDLHEELKASLVENIQILSDNMEEVTLDPSVEYVSETVEYPMALDLTASPVVGEAGFDAEMYLGIIGNSPRMDRSVEYIRYLFSRD